MTQMKTGNHEEAMETRVWWGEESTGKLPVRRWKEAVQGGPHPSLLGQNFALRPDCRFLRRRSDQKAAFCEVQTSLQLGPEGKQTGVEETFLEGPVIVQT